ncbi:hypothetical protein O9G_005415, partial [Rozella allomycis CSF55]
MTFDVSEYLCSKNGGNGKCKACGKTVYWGRQKVISHKRASCKDIPEIERDFFKRQSAYRTICKSMADSTSDTSFTDNTELSTQRSSSQVLMSQFVDNLTVGQRDNITLSFAALCYRTGIPFQVA